MLIAKSQNLTWSSFILSIILAITIEVMLSLLEVGCQALTRFVRDLRPAHDNNDDDDGDVQGRPHGPLLIQRFKALSASAEYFQELPGEPDYQYTWVDDPTAHIGQEKLNAVIDIFATWVSDMQAGAILRPPQPAVISNLTEFVTHANVPLSVAVANLMLQRTGESTKKGFTRSMRDLYANLVTAVKCIDRFYTTSHLDDIKTWSSKPNAKIDHRNNHELLSERVEFGESAELLHFLAMQQLNFGVFGADFPTEAVLQIVADFSAYNKREPVLSFVRVERTVHPPGWFYEDGVLEYATPSDLKHVKFYDYHSLPSQLERPAESESDGGTDDNSLPPLKKLRIAESGAFYNPPTKEPAIIPLVPTFFYDSPTKEPAATSLVPTSILKPRRVTPLRPAYTRAKEVLIPAGTRIRERDGSWELEFPDDEDDSPQLRISSAKRAELLRLEEKRLTEEEIRRKEAEAEAEKHRRRGLGLRPPVKSIIVPVQDGWKVHLRELLQRSPGSTICQSPEGTPLTSRDFATVVRPTEWLNDEIVNGCLLHLADHINKNAGITDTLSETPRCHAFTSFFYSQLSIRGAAGTLKWMRKAGVTKDNFLDIDTILIPICRNNHWTLLVVRPLRRHVAHMDSLGRDGSGQPDVVRATLAWIKGVLGEQWDEGDWEVIHIPSTTQVNGWDCGVHAITNAVYVASGLDPTYYRPDEMEAMRYRLASLLIAGGLKDVFSLKDA
jgi:hypothetical protein